MIINKSPIYFSNLKAVIFDMDGVLVDSEPVYYRIEQDLFRSLNLTIPPEVHHSFVGMSMKMIWRKIKSENPLDLTEEELANLHKKLIIRGFKTVNDLTPIPGILQLIKFLIAGDIKIALASSSSRELIEIVLSRTDTKRYFPIIVSGDDVEQSKPAPDIFLTAVEILSVDKENSIIIEDSANGVSAAVKAGINCAAYRNYNSGNQDLEEADLIFDDFSELLSLLRSSIYVT
jgi:HAD superfamily hydrolase (TIGR01509 family)